MPARSTPPGPRGTALLRAARGARRYLPGLLQDLAVRYGEVVHIRLGPSRIFLLNSPELAKDVLVDHEKRFEKSAGELRFARRLLGNGTLASEGEFHRKQHRLLSPMLHGAALHRHVDAIVDRALRMQEGWADGGVVEVTAPLEAATLAAMLQILFGVDVGTPRGDELRAALVEAVDALEHLPLPVVPGSARLPVPANRRFSRSTQALDDLLLPMIDERRDAEGADLLTALAQARYRDGEMMDAGLVRDEALSIFRGHKTAATCIAWTWYLLSRHPEIQERVVEEIDAVLGDRPLEVEDLGGLPYGRRAVLESLRMFPPAWMLARRATQDHEAGGYPIPRGSSVIVSPYVIHRDPGVHLEPRRFDPDRFLPEHRRPWHPFAFLPFGGGSKTCLGDEVAPMEGVVFTTVIGSRWRLSPDPSHAVTPAPKATLRFRDGLWLRVERRS